MVPRTSLDFASLIRVKREARATETSQDFDFAGIHGGFAKTTSGLAKAAAVTRLSHQRVNGLVDDPNQPAR